jgi:putative SOS response-associated peptidase YedK
MCLSVAPSRNSITMNACPFCSLMPVILEPDSYDLWLFPGMQNVEAISELLKPCDARLIRCYPVSSRVNHVGNDDQECSRAVEIADNQDRLFV